MKAKAKRLDSLLLTFLSIKSINVAHKAIVLPIFLLQYFSMHGTRLDDRLYRIVFLVLDSRSNSKALIILNTESMI